MAQFLLDALTASVSAIDNQAVFAVQSLLDTNQVGGNTAVPSTNATEEEDIFFCGKCKKQFTSLSLFISHKKEEHCNSSAPSISHPSPNSTNTQTIQLSQQLTQQAQIQQIPSTQLATVTPGVVLSEADLLSLTNIEPTIANCPTVQAVSSPTSPQLQQVNLIGQPEISQQSEQPLSSQSQPHIQAHAVGLSLLTNTFVSTPLFVNSQTSPNPTSNVPNMVLSISNPSLTKDVLLSPASSIGVSTILTKSNNAEQVLVDGIQTTQIQDVTEKTAPSQEEETEIAIVTEAGNAPTKSKKRGNASSDTTEGGTKKAMKLKCSYCNKQFVKNFDLQQHLRCHTGEKPFQCIVCGRAFAQKSNVKKHMQTHKVWPDGLAHTLPKIAGVTEGNNEAAETGNQVEDAAAESTNSNEEMPKDGYVCPYCKFIGKTYFDLKSHMKKHKREKVYKCIINTCGQMFHDLDSFLDHIKTHETEMSYTCHQCNKTFQNLYELGSHQHSHSLYPNRGSRTPQRYFRCSLCLNKYATPAALDHHMATSTHNYSCPFPSCDKVFPCERYLRRHLRIHGSSNVHKCKSCGKGFKTQHYLKVHLLTHSLYKPFMCEQCGAAFNRRDKLKRHHLIHESVKRFKCPFRALAGCPREFNRPDKLKAHILTHSCIKPFICKLCGRTFTRKTHLRDHEKIHSENSNLPYHCKRCGKGFELEKALQTHECADIVTLRKRKADHKYYRAVRIRKLKNYGTLDKSNDNITPRRPGRPKKQTHSTEKEQNKNLDESNDNIDLDTIEGDDIPTAHIEIISTSEDLGPGNIGTVEIPLAVTVTPSNSKHFSSVSSSLGIITNKFCVDSDGNVTLPDGGELPSFSLNKSSTAVIKISDVGSLASSCTGGTSDLAPSIS